jgi:NAD(P)-dependent dehydrogenase (short-subunit alcohol dehydrogenase family)
MAARETAIVFGVGRGRGWALAKRFLTENMQVGVVARDEAKLNSLIGLVWPLRSGPPLMYL